MTVRPRHALEDATAWAEGQPATAGDLAAADVHKPAERAYQGIRRAILTGALKGGEHLREETLAQLTGTSRTPVREALRRLVAEGLATAENRHRYVTDFSADEVGVIFDIRAKLDAYAASIAAHKINQDELARLGQLILKIDELGDRSDDAAAEAFVDLNTDFHTTIVKATRSRQLLTLTAQAAALPLVMIKQFVCDQPINILRSNAQHRDILAALAQGNSQWAETAMAGHVLSTKPRLGGGFAITA
ncbi:GntR family transcriptional regulator [Amorphus sp. MBR-141]